MTTCQRVNHKTEFDRLTLTAYEIEHGFKKWIWPLVYFANHWSNGQLLRWLPACTRQKMPPIWKESPWIKEAPSRNNFAVEEWNWPKRFLKNLLKWTSHASRSSLRAGMSGLDTAISSEMKFIIFVSMEKTRKLEMSAWFVFVPSQAKEWDPNWIDLARVRARESIPDSPTRHRQIVVIKIFLNKIW